MPQTIKQLLLINPWIYDFTAFDLWSKPLGLLYIAALLRKFAYQITFIDCLDNHTLKKKNMVRVKYSAQLWTNLKF